MKQITLTAYSFNELSDKAKDKAREWMRGCVGEDYGWADSTEEDAANVGLKITGWNLDRGASCELSFTETPKRVAEMIREDHGAMCGTHEAAQAYQGAIIRIGLKVADGELNEEDEQDAQSQAEAEFLGTLSKCYLAQLREAWEYALSDEGIDETIEANDYMFTKDGSRTAVLNA